MLSEEVERYRELSGDDNPNTPISRIGGYLDGYERAIEQLLSVPDTDVGKMPCGDCISRQAAIDLADELKDDLPDDDHLSDMVMSHNEGILEYQTKLSLLPPVTPAGKVGHWIDHQMDIWIYAKCSECETIHDTRTNYCPHCGAKMQEVEE